MDDGDLEYWRALAIERQHQIEALRARLVALLDRVPDGCFRNSHSSWLRDLETLVTTADVEPGDIVDVLDDVWKRVAGSTPEAMHFDCRR